MPETTFVRDGSLSFRKQMKPFYWLEMTLVRKLTNRMASFLSEQYETVTYERSLRNSETVAVKNINNFKQ